MVERNRKKIRLPEHDYAAPGACFITVCTRNKASRLSRIVGTAREGGPYGDEHRELCRNIQTVHQ